MAALRSGRLEGRKEKLQVGTRGNLVCKVTEATLLQKLRGGLDEIVGII